MSSQTFRPQDSLSPDEIKVCALYRQILDGWKRIEQNQLPVQDTIESPPHKQPRGDGHAVRLSFHIVPIFWIRPAIARGAYDELAQMIVLPLHDGLEHPAQAKERHLT
jgi:hypothetical protein